MRYCVLILLVFMFIPVSFQSAISKTVSQAKGTLIRNITMEGFVLQDKHQFIKLFKPYRNKYLTIPDMDNILQKIQAVYEEEGYKELVSITYHVIKHRLIFTALMTS